jgi:hypothetical protein
MSQLRTNSIVPVGGIPAGASGGGIIQVVQTQYTSSFNTSSSTFVDVTNFTATITPRSTSNKILIHLSTSGTHIGSASQGEYRILRGSTDPASITGGRMWTSDGYYGSTTTSDAVCTFLDSPATTSATTYKLQIRNRMSLSMTVGIDWNSELAGLHTLTLMEVSG